MKNPKPCLLTVNEVATILRIARQKVYILIETKDIEGVKVGNDWRVRLDLLEELIGPIPEQILSSSLRSTA